MTAGPWHIDRTGARPLTVNRVATMHRQAWATYTRTARRDWAHLARAACIPPQAAIRVIATPLHKDRRSPQDVSACAPEAKAGIDGLVDAGVIVDDDATHLTEVVFRPPWVCGVDGLRLSIEVDA
ncbi:MAG TPA: hypothetical protein VGE43_19550 [Acidimicrobiales bacterium]